MRLLLTLCSSLLLREVRVAAQAHWWVSSLPEHMFGVPAVLLATMAGFLALHGQPIGMTVRIVRGQVVHGLISEYRRAA